MKRKQAAKVAAPSPRIAVAICTYDRYDVLPKAIRSALAQSLPAGPYRVLVIDNSPDHAAARRFGESLAGDPHLDYVVEETPGLSNARNVATRLSGTEFIAFMDDDAVAGPDWLAEILAAFDAFGPEAAVVGGRVRPIWGAPRPSWLHDAMLGSVSVVDWGGETRIAMPEEWFAGTNIAFRTTAILENEGFPTRLGRTGSGAALLSNEEVDLLDRIRRSGGRMIYAPKAELEHLVEPARLTRSWFRKRAAWQATSDYLMDPRRRAAEAAGFWAETTRYFNALPPHERTIRGLLYETDDAGLFRWQTSAIYMMTMMTLAGFDGVELDRSIG